MKKLLNCIKTSSVDPEVAEPLAGLGCIYIEQKKYNEALVELNKSLTLRFAYDENKANTYAYIAYIYCERGNFKQASIEAHKASALDPDNKYIKRIVSSLEMMGY